MKLVEKGKINMKYGKQSILGGILAVLLIVLPGCSGDGGELEAESTASMTPATTQSASPSPEASPSPAASQGVANGNSSQTTGNNEVGETNLQGETVSVVFVGRADANTIEIMMDEQVMTAKLDARMQENITSLALQENQQIQITYEMEDGQMIVKDIAQ